TMQKSMIALMTESNGFFLQLVTAVQALRESSREIGPVQTHSMIEKLSLC
ncbi:hypothetical protein GWI33_023086, partial [Rhynchophorus ferrugineus]